MDAKVEEEDEADEDGDEHGADGGDFSAAKDKPGEAEEETTEEDHDAGADGGEEAEFLEGREVCHGGKIGLLLFDGLAHHVVGDDPDGAANAGSAEEEESAEDELPDCGGFAGAVGLGHAPGAVIDRGGGLGGRGIGVLLLGQVGFLIASVMVAANVVSVKENAECRMPIAKCQMLTPRISRMGTD